MDTFEGIKNVIDDNRNTPTSSAEHRLVKKAMEFLVDEVERARKYEDIGIAIDRCVAEFEDGAPSACATYFQALGDLIDAHPRPD
ncbi:hypothetical protein N9980_00770 [bacterium]|nr:hypothetical protein [bacterium]